MTLISTRHRLSIADGEPTYCDIYIYIHIFADIAHEFSFCICICICACCCACSCMCIVWYGIVSFFMVWYGLVRQDMVWCGKYVCFFEKSFQKNINNYVNT